MDKAQLEEAADALAAFDLSVRFDAERGEIYWAYGGIEYGYDGGELPDLEHEVRSALLKVAPGSFAYPDFDHAGLVVIGLEVRDVPLKRPVGEGYTEAWIKAAMILNEAEKAGSGPQGEVRA